MISNHSIIEEDEFLSGGFIWNCKSNWKAEWMGNWRLIPVDFWRARIFVRASCLIGRNFSFSSRRCISQQVSPPSSYRIAQVERAYSRTNFLSRNRSRAPWKFERPGLGCISIRTIPDGIVQSEALPSISIPSFQYQTKLSRELHPYHSKYHLGEREFHLRQRKKKDHSLHSDVEEKRKEGVEGWKGTNRRQMKN